MKVGKKKFEFMGKTYKLGKRVGQVKMEGGYTYNIYRIKYKGKTQYAEILTHKKRRTLTKIAKPSWYKFYWSDPKRQQWVTKKELKFNKKPKRKVRKKIRRTNYFDIGF